MEPSSSGTEEPPAPAIPTEQKGRPLGKIIAVVIVVLLVIVAVAAWVLIGAQPPGEATLSVTSVALEGTGGSVRNVNTALTFNATVSGPVNAYKWQFGDGSNATVTASTPTSTSPHTYTSTGTFLVLLTVTSPGGQTATNDALGLLQVSIVNPGFTPGNTTAVSVAIASPTTGPTGTAVSFDGNSSYGFTFNLANFQRQRQPYFDPSRTMISNWAWDFGDGTSPMSGNRTAAAKPTHTYPTGGLYPAKLTVTSSATGGQTASAYVTIRIAPSTGAVVKNPGSFVIASIGDPQYLDPAIDYETSGGEILKNVYDRLVQREVTAQDVANPVINNSKMVGMLATSWTSTPDGVNWNFTIRSGVKAADGTTINAYDVQYSLRRVLIINRGPAWILDQSMTAYASDNPATPQNERWAAINASVVATDANHVEFHLASAYGAFLQTLDFEVASILPKAWVDAHGGTVWGQRNSYVSTHTDGSGPFALDHWTPGVELQLTTNANYWGTPKPKLASVLYKTVLDPSTQELLLKNGDVDYAQGIPQKDINLVKTFSGVVVHQNPSIVVDYLGMATDNSWPGDPTRLVNTSPFRDVHVRRAVSYVIDYTYIQTTILQGYGYQMKSPVPNGMPFYNGSAWHYGDGTLASRVTKAQQEMALADPALRGGFTTELWYNTGNPTRDEIATLVQANLANISVTATIRGVSWPQFLDAMNYRQAPLFILGWAPDYLDPDDYIFPLFHSSQCPSWIAGSGNPGESTQGTAASCWNNATVDGWIANAATNQSQPARASLYNAIQKAITDDAVWVYLYQPTALDPMRTWMKGYYFDPMALHDFLYLYKQG